MAKLTRDARVLLKRTSTTGEIPIPGIGDDHTTWVGIPSGSSMIYNGEMFVNMADSRMWTRMSGDSIAEHTLFDLGYVPSDSQVMYLNNGHMTGSPDMVFDSGTNSMNITNVNATNFSGTTVYATNLVVYGDSTGVTPTYLSTLDPDLAMLNEVGGFGVGTTVGSLTGKTFTDLFNKLLFPTIYPTYDNLPPHNTFTKNVSTIQLVGDSLSITFTNGYVTTDVGNTAGRILLNGIYQNSRGGSATSYNASGPGLSVVGGSSSNTITHTVTVGNQTWIGSTNYNTGPQPVDSTGEPYGSPYPAGTTADVSTSIEGVYPLYATTSSNTPTVQPLVSMGSNPAPSTAGVSLIGAGAPNKQTVDIPYSWGNYPVKGIKWFNTLYTTWEYEGGTNTSSLTYWTQSDVTHSGISYRRFEYNDDIGARTWRFEF